MLVRDFIDVQRPMEAAVISLADPGFWARALEGEISHGERTLLARFGLDGMVSSLGKLVEVRIGSPRRQERGTVIDVQWQAAGATAWFPVMQADVLLSALGASWTHVEFNGSYVPPGGTPGRVADRLMLHHVGEHAVRLLLMRLVDELKGVAPS